MSRVSQQRAEALWDRTASLGEDWCGGPGPVVPCFPGNCCSFSSWNGASYCGQPRKVLPVPFAFLPDTGSLWPRVLLPPRLREGEGSSLGESCSPKLQPGGDSLSHPDPSGRMLERGFRLQPFPGLGRQKPFQPTVAKTCQLGRESR